MARKGGNEGVGSLGNQVNALMRLLMQGIVLACGQAKRSRAESWMWHLETLSEAVGAQRVEGKGGAEDEKVWVWRG